MASTEEEGGEKHDETLVSIIVPIHNGSADVVECLQSVLGQTYQGRMQVCIVDDASTDTTPAVVEAFVAAHGDHPRVSFSVFRTPEGTSPGGPGFARNLAIRTLARGQWLCLLDADDVAFPERVEAQLEHLRGLPEDDKKRTVVGSQFVRLPEDSTPKYTAWANGLTAEQLYSHRFRCITLIQPTWFMHRAVYDAVGGYEETYPAYPEDMRFFHEHLKRGGQLHKIETPLVKYRYSPGSASLKIHRLSLLEHRIRFLEETVLSGWDSFSIWGAGRDGRRVFMSLSATNQQKVVAMADISPAQIGRTYTNCWTLQAVPIIHFSEITAPFITCVSPDRYPEFVQNLHNLGFRESIDYFFFI